jgi:hypothetical protein
METDLLPVDAAVAETHGSVSRELNDLLIEFASGLRRATVYGPKHPGVLETATSFVTRYSERRGFRGTLSIAEAGLHLIVEIRPAARLERRLGGVVTGVEHPLLGALAERFRSHEVGEIVLAEGVTAEEIASIMGFLSTEPSDTGRPLGAEPPESLERLPNIRIHGAEVRSTTVLGQDDPSRDPEEDRRLWDEFARAALGIQDSEDEGPFLPASVAEALAVRSGNPAFDRRITRHLLELSASLGAAGPLEAPELRRRFSEVFRRLDKRTMQALLAMSGDAVLQREFMGNAATSLDVDVVFALVEAAAEQEGSDISRWMLRLLSKLVRHTAGGEGSPTGHRSEAAIREQVKALLSGWKLDNPNPEDYDDALGRMSSAARTESESETVQLGVEALRIVQTAIEVEVGGAILRRAVDELIGSRQIPALADLLHGAPEGDLADEIWNRLAERPVLHRLIEEDEPDWDVIKLILPRAGLEAAGPLLDRLAAADTRSSRRRLFDLILILGPDVSEPAVRCLGQPDTTPWYVLRNVLSLLARLETWPDSFDPWPLTDHENPQVRREAVRLCLRMPAKRDQAILRALDDDNSRIVAMGISEAEGGCPAEAEPRLAGIAVSTDGEFAEFRTHCIRALADMGSKGALEALLEVATPRRKGLRQQFPNEGPEVLAALRGLAQTWPHDERARATLDAARASGRPSIVDAAS